MACPLLSEGQTMTTGTVNRSGGKKATRGFTLVELGAVVTIIGILAVLAIVGYRKYILSAKVSEAQATINAIRIAQEDYRAERGIYANVGPTWCPSQGNEQKKWGWNPACNGGTMTWTTLAVHVDGPVQFGYRTAAGASNFTDTFGVQALGLNTAGAPTDRPWYLIQAQADLDGRGGAMTTLVGTSFENRIHVFNEGQ
jgi:type IV pilus assembly protein PilA